MDIFPRCRRWYRLRQPWPWGSGAGISAASVVFGLYSSWRWIVGRPGCQTCRSTNLCLEELRFGSTWGCRTAGKPWPWSMMWCENIPVYYQCLPCSEKGICLCLWVPKFFQRNLGLSEERGSGGCLLGLVWGYAAGVGPFCWKGCGDHGADCSVWVSPPLSVALVFRTGFLSGVFP